MPQPYFQTQVSRLTVHTLVCFHAHPDDEALLTSGTMARAAAEGHRVVLVVATNGELGQAGSEFGDAHTLALHRHREVLRSARALGVARVEFLGYLDSGHENVPVLDPPHGTRFVNADVEEAAARLAEILVEENADILTTYDAAGGYGHPDHVQVHRVGWRAAMVAETPRVLEATVDRNVLLKGIDLAARFYKFPPEFQRETFERAFSAAEDITHCVNVRPYIIQKRVAFRAHASQASADSGDRTLGMFLKLPRFIFKQVLGQEWFREVGRTRQPDERYLDDIFASLRG